jgi:hypothetical protein
VGEDVWLADGRELLVCSHFQRPTNPNRPLGSHDGNHIYFHSFGSDPALYSVRVRDHKLERIVSLKGIRLTIGVIGTWCGLAPDDSPLVLRDIGTQEIYALDFEAP